MTDFQRVCEFNKAFDFPIFTTQDTSQQAADCYKLRISLINEEINELFEAVKQNDIIEEMDACGDILYVAYGMAYSYGRNFDEYISSKFARAQNGESLFRSLSYQTRPKADMLASLRKMQEELKQDVEHSLIVAGDIIFCIYEYQHNLNYDSDYIFDIVHKSNMSKLCDTEEEAAQTVDMYKEKQSDRFDSPYYYKLDSGKYVVKNKSTGKSLKSINYKPVMFDAINKAIC
jgi:predicted HAD superfamily Cof-like phosphohydrolase